MKRMIKFSTVAILSISLLLGMTLQGCDDDDDGLLDNLSDFALGYLSDFLTRDTEEIEVEIDLREGEATDATVDLTDKFPPIGNQGSYGTCVAWAVGYNLRTFLYADEHDLTSSQLSQEQYQFSPKDLFWAIDNSDKGSDCNGTGFDPALGILVSRGVAPLSSVPYESLSDCSDDPQSSWTSTAANYKIDNYRQIITSGTDQEKVDEIKYYLDQERPVVIGAQLGEYFMAWDDESVISYDTDTYNGQHAYHAMIVSGYDNSKGEDGAFRVVNSWGTTWGNDGYIWVAYDFFIADFCFAAYVATDIQSNPDDDDDEVVDDEDVVTGYDLSAYELSDEDDSDYSDPRERLIVYDAYNSGTSEITASQQWSILYLAYNAYDANDYEIIVYDYYTNEYGSYGDMDELPEDDWKGNSSNYYNYIDVESTQHVASALADALGVTLTNPVMEFLYTMPDISGDYYLFLIVDGFDAISEEDETNNYLYFAQDDGNPLTIVNGEITSDVSKKSLNSPLSTVVTKENPNTYKPQAIANMIKFQKRTGRLTAKVRKFRSSNSAKNIKRIREE